MRAFFWAGKEKVNGGQCLVAWSTICRPTYLGGLGVRDLNLQGLALRVRWEWLKRTDPTRPWQGLTMMEDTDAREVFDSLVKIQVGDGSKVLFWRDRWIHGFAVRDIAPLLHCMVDTRTRNRRTVRDALENSRWLQDMDGDLSFMGHMQLLHLNLAISTVPREATRADHFSWPADSSGMYTARSTYFRLCQGIERVAYAAGIWKNWAPLKCKIFMWLAIQHRIWTSDRRARHGLQDRPSNCFTCLQDEDNAEHILIQCVYAREVWHGCLHELNLGVVRPTSEDELLHWWLEARRGFRKEHKRGFDSFVTAVAWALWKQRNARVFNRTAQQLAPTELVEVILRDIREWREAGLGVGGLSRFVRE